MIPRRRFIQDIYVWEEALDQLHIVPAAPIVQDEVWVFREPGKPAIKPFKMGDIKIHRYAVLQDPDVEDRGRIRFPNLCTKFRVGTNRTASPPPRPDDPDGLREENRRRRQNLRPMGPPCHPGIPESHDFQRDLDWEMKLPDDDGRPYLGGVAKGEKRWAKPTEEQLNKKPKTRNMEEGSSHSGTSMSSTVNQSEEEQERRTREEAGRGQRNERGQRGHLGHHFMPRGGRPPFSHRGRGDVHRGVGAEHGAVGICACESKMVG